MKKNAIVINVARGAVWNEADATDAILEGKIGALGCDVFTTEPIPSDHPFTRLFGLKNVSLTPHMAWASVEARTRCMEEVYKNIEAFVAGQMRNRLDV